MVRNNSEMEPPKRNEGEKPQERFEQNQNASSGLAGIDRVGLFKQQTPEQRETASAFLPTLNLTGSDRAGSASTVKAAGDRLEVQPAKPEEKDRIAGLPGEYAETPAKTFELSNLAHRSGNHRTPDAVVRLPENFDPSKPIHLAVYNHGFGSNARSAFQDNKLADQMAKAPPNTVLIVPEWQQDAGSRNGSQGRLSEPGMFKGMIQEVFDKTEGLKGKSLADLDGISIFAHSAGYGPTETEIYKNGLSDKVKSITLLDALYDGHGFDRWIQDNIKDLAAGKKQFNNFFYGTSAASKDQALRIKNMLRKEGLSGSAMLEDYNNGGQVMDPAQIAGHSINFKFSSATDGKGNGPHMSMPGLYVGAVERADALKRQDKPVEAPSARPAPEPQPIKPAAEKALPAAETASVPKPASELCAERIVNELVNRGEKPAVSRQPEDVPLTGNQYWQYNKGVLEDPKASIKQKLEACAYFSESLPKDSHGRAHLTLNDGGRQREFEIARTSPAKGVYLTEMFSRDSAGHEHPVLRFAERNNQIEQQRKAGGGKASYQGEWWSRHMSAGTVAMTGKEDSVQPKGKPDAERTAFEPSGKPDDKKTSAEAGGKQAAASERAQPKAEIDPSKLPEISEGGERVVRSPQDLKVFYRAQDDGVSCSAYSIAMLYSDQALGRPVAYGKEAQSFKALAGTLFHGYRGDLQSIADKLNSLGLDSKAYQYGKVGDRAMSDLNCELDKGHTAVARVINPHTGNAHYVYVAGRDANGNYVIGDPDRYNKTHFSPVAPSRLQKMMSGRDGFVVAWARTNNNAVMVADSAASRRNRIAVV
jgi:hypothetical protein